MLIGTSTQPGVFSQEIVTEMAAHTERPVIMPLSNPTSRSEARPADLIAWTGGRALIATGSPFDPVTYLGVRYEIAQANNALIFPGLGLGVTVARARRVSNGMLAAAAAALAGLSDPATPGLPCCPRLPACARFPPQSRPLSPGRASRGPSPGSARRPGQACRSGHVGTRLSHHPAHMNRRQCMFSAYPGVLDNATLVQSNGLPKLQGLAADIARATALTWKGLRMAVLVLPPWRGEWNLKNLFTGWVDVDLTPAGEGEARRAGELFVERGLLPDVLHTWLLRRAIRTAQLTLDVADRHWIPVRRSWQLNERHYGALQGKNKAQVRDEFGDEQFMLWRRSYDTPPPPLRTTTQPGGRPPVRGPTRVGAAHRMPRGCRRTDASLLVRRDRPGPSPDRVVLVVAHGNSLRGLKKHLDGLSDEEVVTLNVPTGIPLRFELDDKAMPDPPGEYLDPEAAAAAIEAVASQGRTSHAQPHAGHAS